MARNGFVMVQVNPANGEVETSVKFGKAPFKKDENLAKQSPLFGDETQKAANGGLKLIRRAQAPIVWVDKNGSAHDIFHRSPWSLLIENPEEGVWGTEFADPGKPDGRLHLRLVHKFDCESGDALKQQVIDRMLVQAAWNLPENGADPFPGEDAEYRARYEKACEDVVEKYGRTGPITRKDLRHLPIFTIDNDDSRDLDDALHISRITDNRYVVGIHIADVTAYMDSDSERDQDARIRGTSHYFEDVVLHMLPECLSADLCSLLPGQDRLAVTMLLDLVIERDGRVRINDNRIFPSLIHSNYRFSYSEADKALNGDESGIPGNIVAALKDALKIGKAFKAGRPQDLSEPNDHGESGELIEHFMVTANQVVGEKLAVILRSMKKDKDDILYRYHPSPDKRDLLALAERLTVEGLMTPFDSKELLGAAEKRRQKEFPANRSRREENAFFSAALHREIRSRLNLDSPDALHRLTTLESGPGGLRIWKAAGLAQSYSMSGHHGLGISRYAWFTSPIRRYPDIVNHRFLKSFFNGDLEAKESPGIDSQAVHRLLSNGRNAQRAYRQRRDFASLVKLVDFGRETEIQTVPLNFRMFGPYKLVVTAEVAGLEIAVQLRDCRNAVIERYGLECRLSPPGKAERILRPGRAANLRLSPGDASMEAACLYANTDQWI